MYLQGLRSSDRRRVGRVSHCCCYGGEIVVVFAGEHCGGVEMGRVGVRETAGGGSDGRSIEGVYIVSAKA